MRPLTGQAEPMDDDEVDAVLAHVRHRDAIRILVASVVVGVPLIVSVVMGADLGGLGDSVLTGLLGICVVAGCISARSLIRERRA